MEALNVPPPTHLTQMTGDDSEESYISFDQLGVATQAIFAALPF